MCVFPYWGSCGWYRRLLADNTFPQAQGHDLTRTLLQGGETLSLPLEGGFRPLRRPQPSLRLATLTLSGHGDWKRTHPETLRALYGKTPYFAHYFPDIMRIYADAMPGQRFADFTLRLHQCLEKVLSPQALLPFRQMCAHNPQLFATLRSERIRFAQDNISILHLMFHLGPEAPFTLIQAQQSTVLIR